MKLLIISHSCMLPTGQQFYAEIERLTGWDLTIVTPAIWQDEYGNQLTPTRWPGYKGKLISIPVWKSGSIPLHTYRSFFTQLLKDVNPDFIYLFQEPYAIVTFQVYLANYLTIRKPIGTIAWQNIHKNYPPPFRQMERWVLQQTRMLFPGSEDVENVFRQKGYGGPTTRMPFGIDPTVYCPRPEAAILHQQLQHRSDEVIIGYVGRITAVKGLKTLLLALKLIETLPWRFVTVGAGEYLAEFNDLATQLDLSDRIQHLGYLPGSETPRYLAAFDVLVLPSETYSNWKEQFGRVIIEAMACGTPVVGSDSGEIPHLLRATGGGLIFPEANPPALADQLQKIILNPSLRQEIADVGRQAILQSYTHTPLAQRFASAIEQTVAGQIQS
jgi:L-malate glycosyltransferase